MPDMAHPNEFTVHCPVCQEGYQVPSTMAGIVVTCRTCHSNFQIANQPELPPPPVAPLIPTHPQLPPPGPMIEGPDFHYDIPPRKHRGAGFVKSMLLIGSGAALVVALSNYQELKNKKASPRGAASATRESDSAPDPAPQRPSMAGSAFPSIDNNKPAPAESPKPAGSATDPASGSKISLTESAPAGTSIMPDEVRPAILMPDAPGADAPPDADGKKSPPAGSAAAAATTGAAPASAAPAMAATPAGTSAQGSVPPAPSAAPAPAPAAAVPAGVTTLPAPPAAAAAAPARTVDSKALRQDSRLTLEKFLLAPDLATRLSVTQQPDKVKAEMEAYYQKKPIAPLPLEAMTFLTEAPLPDSAFKFHLYNVSIKGEDAAIPFAVEETADGFRVDWQTFVESYDHKLRDFFAAPTETPGKFRVLLRRAHYFGPAVPGQDTVRVAYSLEPPTRDETFYGWADVESMVYRQKLSTGERAGWEAQSYVIVELAWRGNAETGRWVALQRIVSDSWRAE